MANSSYIAEFNMSDGFTPQQVAKLNQNFRELKSLAGGSAQSAVVQNTIDMIGYPAGFSSVTIGNGAVNADSPDDAISFVASDHMVVVGDDVNDSVSFAVEELTAAQAAALFT